MAHQVETRKAGDHTIHVLRDEKSGAEASVHVGYGFNLFDLKLPVGAEGKVQPILFAVEGFAEKPSSPGHSGIPVLFPFPNRIRDAKYRFEHKEYTLKANNGPNAIHGYALNVPWEVVQFEATDKAAIIEGRFQLSRHNPDALSLWPTDAVLQMRYSLSGNALTLDIQVSNPTAKPLPYGFGLHPYFHLPLTPDGDSALTQVILPAAQQWVLKDFLPIGELQPVDDRLDFRQGKPLQNLKLDDVLTGVALDNNNQVVCRLVDNQAKTEFRMTCSSHFRELVVFTPGWADKVISVEPYTQTTDAINLQPKGINAGLRVLNHGQQESMRIVFSTHN